MRTTDSGGKDSRRKRKSCQRPARFLPTASESKHTDLSCISRRRRRERSNKRWTRRRKPAAETETGNQHASAHAVLPPRPGLSDRGSWSHTLNCSAPDIMRTVGSQTSVARSCVRAQGRLTQFRHTGDTSLSVYSVNQAFVVGPTQDSPRLCPQEIQKKSP